MRVIYIDVYFLVNFAANFLALLCVRNLRGVYATFLRCVWGALLGAVYAVLTLFTPLNFLEGAMVRAATAALMVLITFGGKAGYLRSFFAFLIVSAVFAGVTEGMMSAGGYAEITFRFLILSFAVSFFALSVVFPRSARSTGGGGVGVLLIEHGGKSVRISALHDSGNSLRDPITGGAVAIAGPRALRELFPPEVKAQLTPDALDNPAELMQRLAKLDCPVRFRLVPYSAVGVRNKMLLAFRPDRAVMDGRELQGALVALSPNEVSDGSAYSALIGGAI